MAAATELSTTSAPDGLTPIGMRVENGRLTLGRLRDRVESERGAPVTVLVGFGLACWLGADAAAAPKFGRLTHRATVCVDERGRVVLDRRVRAYLSVTAPADFEVVPVQSPGGLLLIPAEDFDRRLEAVAA